MTERNEREETALFRYGVIAQLVCRRTADRAELQLIREHILTTPWQYPDGSSKLVPERTLRHWLKRYRKQGLAGLTDEARSDKGASKAISAEILDRAEALRKENPKRSVSMVKKLLRAEGFDVSKLAERTLARQLVLRRATKKFLKKGAGSYQRWEQLYVNDMWQSDVSHGIWLRDPCNPGKSKLTKLIAFLDDASRVITHAEFYWDEQLPSLLDCFEKSLLKRGRPCRLLVDNGSIYRSKTFAVMCAELGVELAFCRPRSPQGKGKIERFFLTIQTSFFNEAYGAKIESLAALNNLLWAWLQKDYHESMHSELNGMTPLVRWREDFERISVVRPEELRRAVMLREMRRVNFNTATVTVDGREYQASPDLAGQLLEVRWHPSHIETVELWMAGEFVEVAHEFKIQPWVVKRSEEPGVEEVESAPKESSRKYLEKLVDSEVDRGLLKDQLNRLLTQQGLEALVGHYVERPLVKDEIENLNQFFVKNAPLSAEIIEKAMERAVLVKGSDMHIRYYIEQMEQAIRQGGRE
jgi:transposase InsO family protein